MTKSNTTTRRKLACTKTKRKLSLSAFRKDSLTPEYKAMNVKSLAVALRVECPILSPETSERIAIDLINSTEGWAMWEHAPKSDAVIVGRDCFGFVHNATHLLGSKDGQWVKEWKLVVI